MTEPTDITEAFARFDALKPTAHELGIDPTQVDDEALRRAGDAIRPLYARVAERAGIDYDRLETTVLDRVPGIAGVIIRRAINGSSLDLEALTDGIESGLATATIEGYCVGVLAEQRKQLPDLDITTDGWPE
jgi:hypothetical protein